MNAKAVKDYEFKQIRQPISGFHIGYERRTAWRVQIEFGGNRFTSQKTYTTEEGAKAAAKRMMKKSEGEVK